MNTHRLDDWALRRRLAAEGVSAARVGISRTTVLKAVLSAAPPTYERRAAPTSFALFEEPQARARQASEKPLPIRVH